jgi:hypothetical protein
MDTHTLQIPDKRSHLTYRFGQKKVNIKEQLTFRDVTGKSIWKERLP